MRAALYARFSTDKQREASITDQLRVAERLALEHEFEIVARFSDAAISAARLDARVTSNYSKLRALARSKP